MAPFFPDLEVAQAPAAFRFVDLFAGIGGLRMGLERAGGRSVYTVEFDRFAVQTYSANFGRIGPEGQRLPEEVRDIHEVRVSDLPAYDLLAGGFPCQSFSLAGVSKKLSLGRAHGFDDAKTGNLFFEIARLIDDAPVPPKILFLENVKHLMRHDQGRTFKVIWNTLEDRGYNLSVSVIDARAWVPQHRERTYIIGLHRDVFGTQHYVFPEPPPGPAPVLRDILEAHVDPRYTLSEHLWAYLQTYAEKHRAAGNGFGYGLVTPESVSRTLSARYHKDGSEILVRQEGMPPRRLTPRECSKLMGFPDTFIIPVSDTQAYRQFGNSVAVPVIEALARSLVEQTAAAITRGGTRSGRHRRR